MTKITEFTDTHPWKSEVLNDSMLISRIAMLAKTLNGWLRVAAERDIHLDVYTDTEFHGEEANSVDVLTVNHVMSLTKESSE